MDNPEKLATQGTQDEDKQDEDKQNKSTTQYTCVGHHYTQTRQMGSIIGL